MSSKSELNETFLVDLNLVKFLQLYKFKHLNLSSENLNGAAHL